MSDATAVEETVTEIAPEPWESIEIPGEDVFPRKYMKVQAYKNRAKGEGSAREFTASGPKADMIVRMVLHGGFTRQEIADTVASRLNGCSVSRVAEVIWTMENAEKADPNVFGLPKISERVVRNRKAAEKAAEKAAAEKAAVDEALAALEQAANAKDELVEKLEESVKQAKGAKAS